MKLLALPPELLTLIARHLGPTLRSSVEYLLVSRQWYRAALPAFLSALPLSNIYLSSHDLLRLPPAHTLLSNLIAEKVERLSIRLIGHPSRQLAVRPWMNYVDPDKDESDDDEPFEDTADRDDWMTVGPIASTSHGRKSYAWHTEEHQLRRWKHRVNEKLVALAKILPDFKNLGELSFEASSEQDGAIGPRWDYLSGSTMERFLQSLPTGLVSLTLDLCGSRVVKSELDRTPVHLCSLVALRIQDLENVRLRMRHICPQVLDNSNNLPDIPSRLSSLVIRLSLPWFPEANYETHSGYPYNEYDTEICPSSNGKLLRSSGTLLDQMTESGNLFARTRKLNMMRVTYRDPNYSGINLYVADCAREKYLHDPREIFTYDDDGRQWDAWEMDDDSLHILSDFQIS